MIYVFLGVFQRERTLGAASERAHSSRAEVAKPPQPIRPDHG